MVPGGRVGLPTPAFSGPRSTGELPRHRGSQRFYGCAAGVSIKESFFWLMPDLSSALKGVLGNADPHLIGTTRLAKQAVYVQMVLRTEEYLTVGDRRSSEFNSRICDVAGARLAAAI
jgi:hypothetical protein